MDITVPNSFDNEWQISMLSALADRMEALADSVDDSGYALHDECVEIVKALQEYSGN